MFGIFKINRNKEVTDFKANSLTKPALANDIAIHRLAVLQSKASLCNAIACEDKRAKSFFKKQIAKQQNELKKLEKRMAAI